MSVCDNCCINLPMQTITSSDHAATFASCKLVHFLVSVFVVAKTCSHFILNSEKCVRLMINAVYIITAVTETKIVANVKNYVCQKNSFSSSRNRVESVLGLRIIYRIYNAVEFAFGLKLNAFKTGFCII